MSIILGPEIMAKIRDSMAKNLPRGKIIIQIQKDAVNKKTTDEKTGEIT